MCGSAFQAHQEEFCQNQPNAQESDTQLVKGQGNRFDNANHSWFYWWLIIPGVIDAQPNQVRPSSIYQIESQAPTGSTTSQAMKNPPTRLLLQPPPSLHQP
ncbi:hypothetical protein PCASD_26277, partial [Puccinia coronata f. sp. avenae]